MFKIRNLSKTYQTGEVETTALDRINLEIEAGEYLAITGPSGCGKSTLLGILGLLDAASSGEYWFDGQNVAGWSEAKLSRLRRGRIGFVFQSIDALSVPNACAFGVRPAVLDMASGVGPAFVRDMTPLLQATLQQPLVYLEQTACGAVVLSGYNGGRLAFIPHEFQTGDARANGVYPVGLGQYQVVRGGQSLTIAPALVHLEQLIGLLGGASVSHGGTGVLIARFNGQTYVVQPGVAVQVEAATGSARLIMGGDGYWHFIDALGNNQILYPAFADAAILRDTLKSLNPAATLTIQLDGTASVVINGLRSTWIPDLELGKVPAERVGQYWWQESATRQWVANAQPLGMAQGFTVKP